MGAITPTTKTPNHKAAQTTENHIMKRNRFMHRAFGFIPRLFDLGL